MHPELNSCQKTESGSMITAEVLIVGSSAGTTGLAGVERTQKKRKGCTFWVNCNETQNTVPGGPGAGVTFQMLQPGEQCCASVKHLVVEVLVHKRAQDGGEDAPAALIRHISHSQ